MAPPLVVAWTPHLETRGGDRELMKGQKVFVKVQPVVHGAAIVLDPCVAEPEKWAGRVKVAFVAGGGARTGHVNPRKVIPLWGDSSQSTATSQRTIVMVVHSTRDFRRLARLEARAGDAVCELGCSYGMGTVTLRAAMSCGPADLVLSGSLLPIDIGAEAVAATAALLDDEGRKLLGDGIVTTLCPVEPKCLDVLDDLDAPVSNQAYKDLGVSEIARSAVSTRGRPAEFPVASRPPLPRRRHWRRRYSWPPGGGTELPGARVGLLAVERQQPSKLFVDVGGDREQCVVTRLLDRLLALQPAPVLIVVKNEALFDALKPPGAPRSWPGTVLPPGTWAGLPRFPELAASQPARTHKVSSSRRGCVSASTGGGATAPSIQSNPGLEPTTTGVIGSIPKASAPIEVGYGQHHTRSKSHQLLQGQHQPQVSLPDG